MKIYMFNPDASKDFTHELIHLNSGATYYQFYMLALELSKKYEIIILSDMSNEIIIDGIKYINTNDFLSTNDKLDINDKVIILVRFYFIFDFLKKCNANQIILWQHLCATYRLNPLWGRSRKEFNETLNYISTNSMKIVCVSNFHKNNIENMFKRYNLLIPNIISIYNALYKKTFNNCNNYTYNKKHILYASRYDENFKMILNLFDKLYEFDNEFRLILSFPSYAKNVPNELIKDKKYIIIKYNENKTDYGNLMKSCLCLLVDPLFYETFGCVTAEAYYLGTPVIGCKNIICGVNEIISKDDFCDYYNHNDFINIIKRFYNERPKITLNKIFFEDVIINEWCNILES